MAKQRVQVAPLEAPTAVKPVASPVETYLRPPEEKVKNPLAEFVSAITPAVKAEQAEIDLRRQQLAREVQAGIAEQQSFQAKLAVTDLLSESVNQYEQNKEYYLEAGPAVMANDRQTYFTDYLTSLEEAGTNPAIISAIKKDLELGTVKFFADPAAGYNQAKFTYDQNKRDALVLDRITKITSNVDMPKQQQVQLINSLVSDYFKTGRDKKGFNDKLMELADKQSGILGETGLTDWLQSPESLNRFGVAEYAESVTRIKRNAAALAAKTLKANDDAWFKGEVAKRVAAYQQTRQQAVLQVGTEIVSPSGKTYKITAEDVQLAYETESAKELEKRLSVVDELQQAGSPEYRRGDPTANATLVQQDHMTRAFEEFYTPYQVLPTEYKNAINSGAYALTTGNTDKDRQMAAQAFQAYRTVESFSRGLTKRSGTLKEDDLLRMRVLETMTGPMGREFDQALNAVQGELFKEKGSKIKIQDIIDNTEGWAWWDDSKFEDVTNPQEVLTQYKDVVQALVMAEGMDVKKAMDIASNYLNDDWLIVESTNGIKTAIPLLNTDIKQYSGQEGAVSTYLSESMLLPEVGDLARSIRGEGAGLSLKVNPSNPNAMDVVVLDQDGGLPPFVIDTVAFSELGTLSTDMLTERLRLEANKKISMDRNAEIYTTINLADLPNLSDDEITARVGIEPEQIEALKVVRTNLNKMLGISEEDADIAAENIAALELEDMAKAQEKEEKELQDLGAATQNIVEEAAKAGITIAPQDTTGGTSDIMDQINSALAGQPMDLSSFTPPAIVSEAQAGELTPLDNVIQTVVSTKGGTPDEVMELALKVGWHESKLKNVRQTTSDGEQDGAGRGYFQYEGTFGDKKSGFNTAVNRAKRDLKVKPEWLSNIKKGDDALSLTFEQQATLFLLDKLGGEGNLGTILSKPKGPQRDAALKTFWRDHHWQGGKKAVKSTPKSRPETTVPARSRSWDNSMKSFNLEQAKKLVNK